MKMTKKSTGDGVGYARKEPYEWEGKQFEADVANGDTVIIRDGGEEEEDQFGKRFVFKIDTRNGLKKSGFNQSSINVLVDTLGDDSETWIGKEVKVFTKKDIINSKRVVIAYFVPKGYMLDEWGDIVKDEPDIPRDEISPDGIPF